MAKQSFLRFVLVASALFSSGAFAQAETALSFTGGSSYTWPGASIGWEFSISQPTTVTALGYYDYGSDGFGEDHLVGIFPAGSNTVLVSTTVTSGDPLQDGFRYASISPFVLQPGNYVVVGRSPTSADLGISFATQQTAPQINYVQEWYLYSGSFELPTDSWDADGGNFGPNFQFSGGEYRSVPVMSRLASAALVLVLLGIGFVGLRRLS